MAAEGEAEDSEKVATETGSQSPVNAAGGAEEGLDTEGGSLSTASRISLASLHPRKAKLVELIGELLYKRSDEKRGYREWSLTTKKINVPTAKDVITKASTAAQEYQSSCLPYKAVDVKPSLGFPPTSEGSVWEQQALYKEYKEQINDLPNAAQTVTGVLYSICKGVTSSVSSSHAALFEGKKKITKAALMEFRKLRGGGMQSEWQCVSGVYSLDGSGINRNSNGNSNGISRGINIEDQHINIVYYARVVWAREDS